MDIKIVTTQSGFDIALDGPELTVDNGLRTAVIISLFTDRRAADDDVIPDGSNDRRGWWANPLLGSRLWLLSREKQTDEVLQRARGYVDEALRWLIDDGIASRIETSAQWSRQHDGVLLIAVVIYGEHGQYSETFNYSFGSA